MVPATVGKGARAVHIGRVRPVVVHPVVVREQCRRFAASPVRTPRRAGRTVRVRIRRCSALGEGVELRRQAYEARQTAVGSFQVGEDKQLIGSVDAVVIGRELERTDPLGRASLVDSLQDRFLTGLRAVAAGKRHRRSAGHVCGRIGQSRVANLRLGYRR